MKTISNTKAELQGKTFSMEITLKRVVIAELEYDNGTTSELMTFFNAENDFELIVSGLESGFVRQDNVTAVKFTVCSVNNGVLEPFAFYERKEFGYDEKIKATNGSHFFYLKRKGANKLNRIMKENNIQHNHTLNYAYAG